MITLVLALVLAPQGKDTTVYGPAEVQERPQLLSSPASNYRRCLQDAGIRGIEGLEFVIDTTGHVEPASVSVVQSADPILDSLATFSVRAEVFRAARRNRAAVRVRVQQPLQYGVDGPRVVPGDSGVFGASCLDQRPASAHTAPVAFPSFALERGDTGTVLLALRIDTTGHVDRSSIRVLSPHGEFDAAAMSMFGSDGTTFRPGRIYGRPVVAQVHVTVSFERGDCRSSEPRRAPGSDPDAIDGLVVKACQP